MTTSLRAAESLPFQDIGLVKAYGWGGVVHLSNSVNESGKFCPHEEGRHILESSVFHL